MIVSLEVDTILHHNQNKSVQNVKSHRLTDAHVQIFRMQSNFLVNP